MHTVGNYTIALKLSGLFLIIPQILQKGSIIHYTSETEILTGGWLSKTILQYTKIHLFLSIVYIVLFLLFGKIGIQIFFGKQDGDFIFNLSFILILGISFYNLYRPFMTLAFAKLSLFKGFSRIYLPIGILCPIIYFFLANYFGAFGIAFGSILVYILLFIFSMLFVIGKSIY